MNLIFTHKWHDPFVLNKAKWEAVVSNGLVFCQDDDLPEADPPRAWDRLRIYLKEQNLKIVSFYMRYMDNVVKPLPDNAEGYFYRDAHAGIAGEPTSWAMAAIGWVHGDKMTSVKLKKPELINLGTDIRDLTEVLDSVWINK